MTLFCVGRISGRAWLTVTQRGRWFRWRFPQGWRNLLYRRVAP